MSTVTNSNNCSTISTGTKASASVIESSYYLRPINEEVEDNNNNPQNGTGHPSSLQLKSQVLRQHTLLHEQKQQLTTTTTTGTAGVIAAVVEGGGISGGKYIGNGTIDDDDHRSVDSSTGAAYHVPIHHMKQGKAHHDNNNDNDDDDDDANDLSDIGVASTVGGICVDHYRTDDSDVDVNIDDQKKDSPKSLHKKNRRKKERRGGTSKASKRVGRDGKTIGGHNVDNDDDSTNYYSTDTSQQDALFWTKQNIRLAIFLVVLSIVVVISIVVLVILTSGNNRNQSEQEPEQEPQVQPSPSLSPPTIPTSTTTYTDPPIQGGGGNAPPAPISSSQQQELIRYITDIAMDITSLTSSSSDNDNVWDDPNSSQVQALNWILFVDQLPIRNTLLQTNDGSNIDRLLQRYALVQLYYATNGPYWFMNSTTDTITTTSNTNEIIFLNPTLSECNWTGVTCGDRNTKHRRRRQQSNQRNLYQQQQQQYHEAQQLITSLGSIISSVEQPDQPHQQWNNLLTPLIDPNTMYQERMMQSIDNNNDGDDFLNNQVFRLFFPNMNLTGTIPHELGKCIPQLYEFDLSNNNLYGTIPDGLFGDSSSSSRSALYWFDVSSNQLSGTIPSSIWNLQELRFLFLSQNRLSGRIERNTNDTSISNSEDDNATDANEDDSDVSSTDNSTIGVKRSNLLKQIQLYENFITGSIPSWFHELSDLEQFIVFENELTGPLPNPIPTSLLHFDISFNNISGTIPNSYWSDDIGSSSGSTVPHNIEKMYLDHNQLTGTLPNTTILRQPMQRLWINDNYGLTGTIPDGFGTTWNQLVELHIHRTNLTGQLGPSNSSICSTLWPNIMSLKSNCLRRMISDQPPINCTCCTLCESVQGQRVRRQRR